MTSVKQKKIVNSWDEFSPLKHVIVGKADNGMIPHPEPALEAKMSEDMLKEAGQRRSQESIDKANAQLDNFAKILEERGIKVDRPTTFDFSQKIGTPDWEAESMMGCMPPRDVLLTIGNEILEATMSYRCRWFEYLCYRDLLWKYFEEDPEMKWEAAPKPRLLRKSYREEFLQGPLSSEQKLKYVQQKKFATAELEPLFDAADVLRLGKDLFVQHAFTTNLKAMDWLQRHFPDHRVHPLNFPTDPEPIHIDATFVPLRPGLIINNPNRRLPDEQRKIFEKNDWQIVDAAQPAHDNPPPLCYSSVWLSMNCLVLDEKTVCIEASEVHQQEQMSKFGFEVIPVPFRDAYPYGGGLHCATADIYREGKCEDYFPKQV